jgi:L-arabinose isomerase
VRLRFTAAPGAGVVVGVSDMGGRFRLTLNEIDVVRPDEALPLLPVACAVWKPQPDLATSAESWLLAGGPHHTVLSTALRSEEYVDLAEMLDVELVRITADSTTEGILRELRWNAAYHRLAARL